MLTVHDILYSRLCRYLLHRYLMSYFQIFRYALRGYNLQNLKDNRCFKENCPKGDFRLSLEIVYLPASSGAERTRGQKNLKTVVAVVWPKGTVSRDSFTWILWSRKE
jgi:hypothetical protein